MSDIKETEQFTSDNETPGPSSTNTPEPTRDEIPQDEEPKQKKNTVQGYEIVSALPPLIVYSPENAAKAVIAGIVAIAFLKRIGDDIVGTKHLLTLGKHLLGLWCAGKFVSKHARKGFQPPTEEEEFQWHRHGGKFEKGNLKIDVHVNFDGK